MTKQPALPFEWPAGEAEDAVVVGLSNRRAYDHLHSHARWPVFASVLVGPRKSGRSLFGRIFVHRTAGRLIEEGEQRDETELFHAWNEAQADRRPLLITAEARPAAWRIGLPDLRSRIAATPVVEIGDPDDALMGALLAKLLERRGIVMPTEVVGYLVPRMPRSYVAVVQLAEALDAAALAERRTLTVPFARSVLTQLWEGGRYAA